LAFTATKIETTAAFREKLAWKLSLFVTDPLIIPVAMMPEDIDELVATNCDFV
jgi:hypothetical protein